MENESILEERLVAELGWLQKLARSLVHDIAVADDVVQDVMVAGLETRRVAPQEDIRRDLFNKVRARIFSRRREAARRRFREQSYAKTRAGGFVDSVARVVSEADTADVLMKEVMALPETHRAILLLCYFEGRPQREVAATLGVTNEAVRARLKRARTALRKRLDSSSDGGREGWLPGLGALAGRTPAAEGSLRLSTWAAALGWSGMKVVLVILVAAVVGAALWQLRRVEAPMNLALEPVHSAGQAQLGEAPALDAVSGTAGPDRLAIDAAPDPVEDGVNRWLSELLPAATTKQITTGRVVSRVDSREDVAVEGAVIRVLSHFTLEGLSRDPSFPVITATTEADGTFRVEAPSFYHGVLEVTYPGMRRTFAEFPEHWRDPIVLDNGNTTIERDEDIVLLHSTEVTGRVQDAEGRGIAGVEVHAYSLQNENFGCFDNDPLTPKVALLGKTQSDGNFRVLHSVGAEGELYFRHPDFLPKVASQLVVGDPMLVTMSEGASISGQVFAVPENLAAGARGRPLPLIVVAVKVGRYFSVYEQSGSFGRVGEDGQFTVGGLVPGKSYRVQAWSGSMPAYFSEPRSLRETAVAGGDPVELQLRAGIELSMRVLDTSGKPFVDEDGEGPFVSAEGEHKGQFLTAGLFLTPLHSRDWVDGEVRFSRVVPAAADAPISIEVYASGKKRLVRRFGPFEDGAKVDLGDLIVEDKAPPIPTGRVGVQALTADGRPLAGATIERLRPGRRRTPASDEPIVPTAADTRACRVRDETQVDDAGQCTVTGLNEGLNFVRVGVHAAFHVRKLADPPGGGSKHGVGIPWTPITVRNGRAIPSSVTAVETQTTALVASIEVVGRSTEGGAVAFADPYDRQSIADARWAADEASRGGSTARAIILTEAGDLVIDRAPVGEWLMVVSAPGEEALFERLVSLGAPAARIDVTLDLSVAKGVVTDVEGQPVEGALVTFRAGGSGLEAHLASRVWDLAEVGTLRHPRFLENGAVLTEADGSYALPMIARSPGWSLIVEHDRYATSVTPAMGAAGPGPMVLPTVVLGPCGEIQVNPGGRSDIWSVSAIRVDEGGTPRPNEWALLHFEGYREGFVFERVPVGRVTVHAFDPLRNSLDVGVFEVRAGERTTCTVDPDAELVPANEE